MSPEPSPPSPAPADRRPSIDPKVWKACAGSSASIPAAGTLVYYFPQGHAEHALSPPHDLTGIRRAAVHCRITAVRLHASPDTDEVLASIALDPCPLSFLSPPPSSSSMEVAADGPFLSFAKILTVSDANNGGGFSVPRFCAESIFPPLDFSADPPVQTIVVSDVHGEAWRFRHIFRGTPRRHLLTTGWSKFLNAKRLVAGDSVVFMRNQAGKLIAGIRRTGRLGVSNGNGGGRGRVSVESVAEALRSVEENRPFEVVYYPGAGLPEFVVAREVVEGAVNLAWSAGMRVRMPMETDDSARMTWFQGTVSSVVTRDASPWGRSPWRMLQVTWDEPEVLQDVKCVSPWNVELISTDPPFQSPYPGIKGLSGTQNSKFHAISEQITGGKRKDMDSLSSSPSFLVGMQGARHDSIGSHGLSSLRPRNNDRVNVKGEFSIVTSQNFHIRDKQSADDSLMLRGSTTPSQGNFLDFSKKICQPAVPNLSKKSHGGTLQLFGQVIRIEQPVEDEEATRVLSPDTPLLYPYKLLPNNVDLQCQKISVLEACPL